LKETDGRIHCLLLKKVSFLHFSASAKASFYDVKTSLYLYDSLIKHVFMAPT